MKRIVLAAGIVFLIVIMAISLVAAPDMLSSIAVAIMLVMIVFGSVTGILSAARFIFGFQTARKNIKKVVELQPDATWLYVQQSDMFFQQKELDSMFRSYVAKARRQLADGKIITNVEDTINEESLSLRSWQGIINVIPGTLTAIGLAGTFIGLILGISNIGFSSVDATIGSIEIMLSGIRTAFYTSIVGLIYSIMFNLISKLIWNVMLREMGLFIEEFHANVLPSTDEQQREKHEKDVKKIITLLERLPKTPGFTISQSSAEKLGTDVQNEQKLLMDVQEGLQNGEFIFYVQPRCDLNTRELVGGEALMRWNHNKMGMVSPSAFLPVLERNGYIAKIDRYIWEQVCKEMRKWMDEGIRPIPVSINVSKTDVLAMDVTALFGDLVKKYHIPPQYLELEFASNAYLQCGETMRVIERELRERGFKVIADGFNGDFTAMNVLKNAEVDAIKLDLRHLAADENDRKEVLASVLEQANALHIPVSVEGIENAEEMATLRRCGFKEGQGYHLYKPMAMEDFKSIIGEHK